MTDQFDNDSDTDGDEYPEAENNVVKQLRAQLRKEQARAKALESDATEAQELRRELLFRSAGIDPSNPAQKYFAKGYDGELTIDAIRSEAEGAGLLTPAAPAVPREELSANAAIDAAAVGASPVGPIGREAEIMAALNSAQTIEQYDQILAQNGMMFTGE